MERVTEGRLSGVEDFMRSHFPLDRACVLPDMYMSRIRDSHPDVPDSELQADPMSKLKSEKKRKKGEHAPRELAPPKTKDCKARLKGEEAELAVIRQLQRALDSTLGWSELPGIILHNVAVGDCEQDILLLHPMLGVVLVEVKALTNPRSMSRVDEAAVQLRRAREEVRKELETEAVHLVIILPNLLQEQVEKTKGRCRRLGDDIALLCGKHAETYQTWFGNRTSQAENQHTYLAACERWVLPLCKESPCTQEDSSERSRVLPLCHSPCTDPVDPLSLAIAEFMQYHNIGHYFYLLRAQHHWKSSLVYNHSAHTLSLVLVGRQACLGGGSDARLESVQRSVCCHRELCPCGDSHTELPFPEGSLLHMVALGMPRRHCGRGRAVGTSMESLQHHDLCVRGVQVAVGAGTVAVRLDFTETPRRTHLCC